MSDKKKARNYMQRRQFNHFGCFSGIGATGYSFHSPYNGIPIDGYSEK